MKEGWTNKTLGEVCKIYNGNSINADYKKKHFFGATEGLPFIATKDVSPLGIIDYNNGVRIPNYEEYKVAPANSVFICAEGGSAGKKFAYVEKDVCFGNKLFCITPKDKTITGKFVYHFVQSDNFRGQFFSLLTGLIGGVSAKKFQTIEIPVPPLSEQQRIVDYLDSAFAKIDAMKANAEKALNEAKALFQASLKEMLEPKEGWGEKTLGNIISHLRTGLNPRTHFKLNTPDAKGYYITVRELKGFTIEPDEKTDRVNSAAIKRINERSNLKIGDVLFSGTGTIGKTAIVNERPENWNIKEGIYAMTPKYSELDSKYFIYYIGSEFFLRLVNDKAAGTGVRSIPMKELVKLPISVPSLSEQQSIVATLDSLKSKVDRLQANFEKISQECDALKQALLREVFEG